MRFEREAESFIAGAESGGGALVGEARAAGACIRHAGRSSCARICEPDGSLEQPGLARQIPRAGRTKLCVEQDSFRGLRQNTTRQERGRGEPAGYELGEESHAPGLARLALREEPERSVHAQGGALVSQNLI
jgi:hypothetical protein